MNEIENTSRRIIPILRSEYWVWTPESTLFAGPEWELVRNVFRSFPEDIQNALTSVPKDGEWVSRIEIWGESLFGVLALEQYAEAMAILLEWALNCQKERLVKYE